MFKKHLIPTLMASLCAASSAQAQVALIAKGSLSGAYQDLSARTAAPLENGVAGNRLGGMGSGIAYAGGSTFLMVPDRGPNAVPFDSAIDDTSSFIARIQTLSLRLAPAAADSGTDLPFVLTPILRHTTLLHSDTPLVYGSGAGLGVSSGAPALNEDDHTFYFTGRSDNYNPATPSDDPRDARLDPESIRVSRDGRSAFISDEYGPHIYEFDRATGRRIRAIQLPGSFAVKNQGPTSDAEISGNTSGRVANKGMEGLAITPDGETLVGIMQSPLIQDGGTNGSVTRLAVISLRTGAVRQYAYPLTNIGSAKKPKYPTVSD
ncbi:MAG TPA: esterase-like activity of phytase family protein, partial [Holophagaceae bacterium]|nr:esterase-like activity of phytase family protein [Holophagaceae bacterium]